MFESLGNIGDFIGGFGVVVTVIYLAFQIRQNTASTRSASYQSVIAAVSEWTLHIGLSRESTRIFSNGLGGLENLSAEEQVQFNFLLASVIRHFENIHFQYLSKAIDHNIWDGWSSRIMGVLDNPGAKEWWDSQKTAFSDDFQALIDDATIESPRTTHFFAGQASQPDQSQ